MPLSQRAALTSVNMRTIWRFHGPKIARQTRYLADALLSAATRQGLPADRLRVLRERLP